jgi:16S rRNA (guanine527-N7)-methyltransferase
MSREPRPPAGPRAEAEPLPPEVFAGLLGARARGLDAGAVELLARYLAELDAWRRRINLTGRLTPEELVAHALESLPAVERIARQEKVVDIGSGSGFPAIPLAILRPAAAFTLFEPTAKKAAFLRHVARALALPNVSVRAARIEDAGPETFDVATTRAVGSLGTLIGDAAFLRPGGRLLVWTTGRDTVARELPALRLTETVPIAGSRSKALAVLRKPVFDEPALQKQTPPA